MRKGFFCSLAALALGSGIAGAQMPGGYNSPGYPGYAMPGYQSGYYPGYAMPGYQSGYYPRYAMPGYQTTYYPGYAVPGYQSAYYSGYAVPGYQTAYSPGYAMPTAPPAYSVQSTPWNAPANPVQSIPANTPAHPVQSIPVDVPANLAQFVPVEAPANPVPSVPVSAPPNPVQPLLMDTPASRRPVEVVPEQPAPAPSLGTIKQAGLPVPNEIAHPTPSAAVVLDNHATAGGAGKGVCGPPGRLWGSAEYLLWWVKGNRVPPLVTTGPATSPTPGALGVNGTGVLFGNEDLDHGPLSGGRFTAGYWLNCGQTVGIEASYFFLAPNSNDFTASSSGAPGSIVLARPFFDVSTGLPNSELVSFPGLSAGTVSTHSTSRLQGGEANLLYNLCCSCNDDCHPAPGYRVDLIGGFRYLQLREGLGIAENLQVFPGAPVFPGDNIRVSDQFDTRNQFYGGQLGVRAEVWRDRLFANITGKVGLGDMRQSVDINGSTTITPPGGPALVAPGGLLALPSNFGHFTRDAFSVVPEVGVNVGYQVTNHLRVFVGYTFLYASDVVRPGNAIDLGVNSTRLPTSLVPPSGPLRPVFTFRDTDFWAQGINFGVGLRY